MTVFSSLSGKLTLFSNFIQLFFKNFCLLGKKSEKTFVSIFLFSSFDRNAIFSMVKGLLTIKSSMIYSSLPNHFSLNKNVDSYVIFSTLNLLEGYLTKCLVIAFYCCLKYLTEEANKSIKTTIHKKVVHLYL